MATYQGTAGNDNISGGGGNDSIVGNAGNDTLAGNAGNDTILGGAGTDTVRFRYAISEYNISWDPVAARYRIEHRSGRDGVDYVCGVEYFQFADVTRSIANLVPGAGDGTAFTGTSGNDSLAGGVGYDTLNGGAGDDRLQGGAANDRIDGGTGNDTAVFSGALADYRITWNATARQYTIVDTIAGRDGTDTVSGVEFFQFADGTRSISQLPVQGGDGVTLAGTSANEVLSGSVGYDTLSGLGGNDTLDGGDGADVLQGGAGDDRLRGGGGDDSIVGGDGTDVVQFSGGRADYLVTWDATARQYTIANTSMWGTDGTDVVRGVEVFQFADGMYSIADLLPGEGDGVSLTGTSDGDVLVGAMGYDALWGLEGNDTLDGGDAADVLQGGAGDDRLRGGRGNDTIVGGDGTDVVHFSGGRAEYLVAWDASTRQYTMANTGMWGTDGTDVVSGVEVFQFADGTYSIADLVPGEGDGVSLTGTSEGDVLVGGMGYDTLTGLEGNDLLDGGDGGDILWGWEGDDRLRGGRGDDMLSGGDGRDVAEFSGSRADYTVSWDAATRLYTISHTSPWGTDGTDIVAGVEYFQFADGMRSIADLVPGVGDGMRIIGTSGDDFLAGDAGYDELWGGRGNDRLDGGDAGDTLHGMDGDDQLRGGRGDDVLDGGAGRDVAEFSGMRADYLVTWDAATRQYTLANTSPWGGDGTDVVSGVEHFYFADGVRSIADLLPGEGDGIVLTGTAGDDVLQGDAGFDLLQGGDGNDMLVGGAANDTLRGGAGDDMARFSGRWTDYTFTWDSVARQYTVVDMVQGRDGIDIVSGVEFFGFADGTLTIYNVGDGSGGDGLLLDGAAGDDLLRGSVGYDRLRGLDGNDSLDGGGADDTLEGGAGSDQLSGGTGRDVIIGGEGVDIAFYDGYRWDYSISWDAATRTYTIQNNNDWFYDVDTVGSVEVFSFRNGTYTIGDLVQGAGDGESFAGTDGNDTVYGSFGYDTLQGLDGQDFLDGQLADDVIDGGAGDDILVGNVGNDRLDGGDGEWDMARYSGYSWEYAITWNALTREYTIADQYGYGRDGTDTITRVEYFEFRDGWRDWSNLVAGQGDGVVQAGTDADDGLYGSMGYDTVSGGGGNDYVYTRAGDDFVYGGAGDDTLDGGAGNDYIDGGDGFDTVQFSGYSWDFDVTWDAGTGEFRFIDRVSPGHDSDVLVGVEQVGFYDGMRDIWSTYNGTWPGQVLPGTAGNDYMIGTPGADTMEGYEGSDALRGQDGADVLRGGADDDLLAGGAGHDVIDGGEGQDAAVFSGWRYEYDVTWDAVNQRYTVTDLVGGRDGSDLVSTVEIFRFYDGDRTGNELVPGSAPPPLLGTEGDDWLPGTPGNDTLLGLGGNDMIAGWGGNDTLDGGAGNDTLDGGAGADTYVLRGEGVEYIANFVAGEDHIELSGALFDGLPKGQLWDMAYQAGPYGSAMNIPIRVAFDTETGTLMYDPDGSDGQYYSTPIAVIDLQGMTGTPTAQDFWIV
ncbi:hypothetical protein H8N03_20780 [Ramlibacter sp. USB13]|uniref:Calcium-binding protein n=1 Tax=Ramlibacter cellulosilyticus TaxID=2764187 RepID=A0A923SCW9_9BURK|nr:calcium-binding protein [Ramlibacter cellulosilyticus]MBC5785395.1 hypothetical protein [Ramlibacter cellulosilyticus]